MTTLNVEVAHRATDVELPHRNGGSGSSQDNGAYESLEMIDQLPVVEIPISSLERGLFQRGSGTDPAHVKLLAEAASSRELPPILVQKNNSRIVDGMHRLEAAKLRGERTIRARFINCADEDAFILAVKSNTLHGLPLSRADRICGAKRILTWHPEWSDRAVGMAAGLGTRTIASLRRRSDDSIQQSGKRLGRDGKRHPVAGANGRRRAADYLASRPDASLREIAREADVSLGTARDVRARVRRGLEPMTAGQQASAPGRSADPAAAADAQQPGNIAGLRNMSRTDRQATWTAISAKLINDPSLRYSESGRKFLRWMAMYAMHAGEWKEFMDAVPPHWLKDISLLVDNVRDELRQFTEQLRQRQNQAI